ncbi:M28 family peptidase [Chryseobacterium sp. Ch-15]|uniref:M28 family peptidase n=1 Tax=Chryseobacterium muglaense TaxID=2893752 RepID=A0A9Q3UTJ2_9FLAO|nr:M28 family peptidase [Chryseobacterium muglaense]MBD3904216.1 M28 family peptidase [Chryseobacterium muglaense]MCC9033211.1 M28 family peptidase [Chryseobacterium muglaense]MCM2553706.1 M28 family peptidase [Chryseobacterium muglaense]
MKKLTGLLLLSLASYNLNAQIFIPAYQTRANQVTQANVTSLLQDFESFGVKTSGSTANNNTLNWLKAKYQTYGYSPSQITEDSFTVNGNTTKNLIITKTGTVYPNTYVIICGHYDTIVGPGVSDNGSGTSILLEAARILKDVPTEYSVKFIHFSGEEQGLLGSYHYVNNVVFQNGVRQMDIRLVFNIDQVGGKLSAPSNSVKCESDQAGLPGNNAASLSFTQQLAACTTLYSPLQTVLSNAYSSDYVPFEGKGDIITGFYETPQSQNEHTANDTFANVDPTYVFKVGKAAVGALQHFAIASSFLATHETSSNLLEDIKIYPNPAKDILNLEIPKEIKNFNFEIKDMSGRLISAHENEKTINVSKLSSGVYLCTVKSDGETVTKKVIIEK